MGLLLVVATFMAYLPVWHAGFIWDDDRHVTLPILRSLHGLARIWIQLGATQQYYPLVHSVFWLEHKLWGDFPLGYHLLNVLLHAGSALLLAKILQQLKMPGAWLAAALFALHPVEVESVAWVSELKNTLSGFFYLGAALAYLEFDRNRNWKNYAAALALFALGLMSKTVIASLPGALLVAFWWQRGRLSWKKDLSPLIPFFIAGMGAGLLTAWVERRFIHAEGAEFNYSLIERFLIAGRAIWFYLGKIFWPVDLSFIYPRWQISQTVGWQYLFPVAALLLLGGLFFLRRQWRGPLAALLFFVGTLFPALGFFNVYPFRYSFVADHFQYLASLGPLTLLAAGLTSAVVRFAPSLAPPSGERARERGSLPFLPQALCAILLLTLAALTWRQCRTYLDAETLWRTTLLHDPASTIARNNLSRAVLDKGQPDEAIRLCQSVLASHPNDVTAQFNLGDALLRKGRFDEAIVHLQKALELQPAMAGIPYAIGEAYLKKGQMDAAIRYFEKTIQLQPDYAVAFCNLGYALLQEGHRPEAVAAYSKALELDPRYALAHNDLGSILLQSGRAGEALDHFRQAVEILPNFAEARFNLAEVLLARGRLDDAISQYQKTLEFRPDLAEAHYKLANILAQQGREAEAISHYESALRTQPDLVRACNNLAWILATAPDPKLRNGPKAVELAQRANRLSNGKNPVLMATLAAAYAEAGQFGEAVRTIEQALPLAAANATLTSAFQKQEAQYKAGQPFHETPRP
jgi:tetratricopeptide (TPR) repeat protein